MLNFLILILFIKVTFNCTVDSINVEFLAGPRDIENALPQRYNKSQVHSHFANQKIEYSDILNTPFCCIDSRTVKNKILGTPGGDVGEFLIGAKIYFDMLKINSTYTIISLMLEDFIKKYASPNRKFTYHTSEFRLNRLFDNLYKAGVKPRPSIVPLERPDDYLTWYELFIDPQHQGCGHIRGMLENPSNYGINDISIVQNVLIAYLILFWKSNLKDSIEFNIKVGLLHGKAISIIENESVNCKKHNPVIYPQSLGSSTFIYHEQAVKVFRKEVITKFFTSYNNTINEEEFYDKLNSLANVQLETTINTLKPANQVNVFKVTFKTSGKIEEEPFTIELDLNYIIIIASSLILIILILICSIIIIQHLIYCYCNRKRGHQPDYYNEIQ